MSIKQEEAELTELLSVSCPPNPKQWQKTEEVCEAYETPRHADADTNAYVQWTQNGRNLLPVSNTIPKLPPGVYGPRRLPDSVYLERLPMKEEEVIRFKDSPTDEIIEDIQTFWQREDVFRRHGLSYKRGILMWGPAGSGKTSACCAICEQVISMGGIVVVFDASPCIVKEVLGVIRDVQLDTPVVVLMEDLEAILNKHEESEVLNLLDGVGKVHKIVFLATTNYPGELGARIVNRPSRFDRRLKVGLPREDDRLSYLEYLFRNVDNIDDYDLVQWAEDTDGLSVAHLKELFISVVIQGQTDYSASLERLKGMKDAIDDRDENAIVGFGS